MLLLPPKITQNEFARQIAITFLDGQPDLKTFIRSLQRLSDMPPQSLMSLATTLYQQFAEQSPAPLQATLVRYIEGQTAFKRMLRTKGKCLITHYPLAPLKIDAHPTIATLLAEPPLHLPTPKDLADWLGLNMAQLDWFADCHGRESFQHKEPLRHYRYQLQHRANGNLRIIEAPKPCLKAIQRRILIEILNPLPIHACAHGFCKGRSVVSYAAQHVHTEVVLRLDLRDFFASIPYGRVMAVFQTLGYPEACARLLAGLCTNSPPAAFLSGRNTDLVEASRYQARMRVPHLPAGAPTSGALANLCSYRLDLRIHGLARSIEVAYSRYADDIALSGDHLFRRQLKGVLSTIENIVREEGFYINHAKTKIMGQAGCQRLAGITLNEHLNIARHEFDQLKAILFNCVRFTPQTQNKAAHPDFKAHLAGRLAQMKAINPIKTRRLYALFDSVVWES